MEYKVMLVDDDYFVLEYLSKSIRWNELGFFEPQCYQNGMEACQSPAPEQPYVLITDIGMPKMDGIQLIRKLKEAEHSVYPIIISCHDDFDYARQAVKLEVFDYILKESMDAAEVEKMLCRLKEKMDEAGRIRQQTDKLQNKIEQNRYILKEKFLRQTLESPMIREENWYKEMQSFGISDPRQYLLPVYCRILGFQELLSRYRSADTLMFALENVAEEVVGDTATCFRYSKNELFMLFPFKDRLKTSYFQAAEKQCERLGKELRDILQMDVVFLAGDLCRGQKALRCEILRMLEHRSAIYYEGKRTFLRSRDMDESRLNESLYERFPGFFEEIYRAVLDGNRELLSERIESFFDDIERYQFSPRTVEGFLFKLMFDLQMKLRNIHPFHSLFSLEKLNEQIQAFDRADDLRTWLKHELEDVMRRIEEMAKNPKRKEIIMAQKYIALHLDKKITLEEIASYLHLNPSYFSRLFKKELGETLIAYINRVKMEKAYEWLENTDQTVEEISKKLGFDHKSYFLKVFRSHFGVSPSEIKSQLTKS